MLAPGDEVAVFFSGHGVEIEGGNYLVPRDVPAVGTSRRRSATSDVASSPRTASRTARIVPRW